MESNLSASQRYKKRVRGKCCRVCDRKFIIRDLFVTKFELMENQAIHQKQLQGTVDRMMGEWEAE